jgi:Protein of unknown function (DUF3108)
VTPSLKRLILALASLAITLTALPSSAQRKSEITALPFSDAPYFVGERLTYNVSFSNFVSAAHVELFVAAHGTFFGRDAIQLTAHVETTGVVYAALYALNNDYISYVDPANGQPFRVQQIVREATARAADTSTDFNQPAGTAAIPEKLRIGEFPGNYDFLSALYRLRALPLTDGATYSFTVRSESQQYQAELRVKGHEAVRTNVGSFNTIVSQVRVPNNSEANDYRLQIYFTDDVRHVPVLLTARARAGEIRAELAGSQVVPTGPNKGTPGPVAEMPQPRPSPTPPKPEGSSPPSSSVPLGLPFKVSEQLNYRVYLASVQQPVGMASFQVRAHSRYFNHDGLMLTVSAQTTDAARRLFLANDQLTSYVDPQTLLPFRTELNLSEGSRRRNEILTINQDYGTAMTQAGKKIEIPVGTHDLLSIFYAVRSMNLAPPKLNAVSILVNGKPKTLRITAMKRETIQLDTEKIPAVEISLTTDDQQEDKFQLRAWISDDDRRLPLRFTAMTELGPLRADLVILPVTRQ